jgi:hypothetical protein
MPSGGAALCMLLSIVGGGDGYCWARKCPRIGSRDVVVAFAEDGTGVAVEVRAGMEGGGLRAWEEMSRRILERPMVARG